LGVIGETTMEQKYGPQGTIWMDASLANLPFVVIPAVASLIPALADQARTSRIALYLLAAAFLFLVLNFVRLLQASNSGRKFRSERH
jgi:ABC-type branched-subunit amino acid transport system permease subunit